MASSLAVPVDYFLRLDEAHIPLNPCIGHRIRLTWHGRIACTHCGNPSRKSYGQGYCYPCFKKLAQCDLCVVSPERCHYAEGTCREPEWGQGFCMQPHLVYLANSSGIKVGITKQAQLPTRWIDQGAVQALPIFNVDTRQQAGYVEVALKQHISDKTQWQRMLKADDPQVNLKEIRDDLLAKVTTDIDDLRKKFGAGSIRPVTDTETQLIRYPVDRYPTKVVALNLDREKRIEGVLLGIKGQYLIFDNGVINLRRYTAYDIEFEPMGEVTPVGESLRLF